MVRVNGGPWIKAPIKNNIAEAHVPVSYGSGDIEAQVIDNRGVRNSSRRKVQSAWQPTAQNMGFHPDFIIDDFLNIDGFGPI